MSNPMICQVIHVLFFKKKIFSWSLLCDMIFPFESFISLTLFIVHPYCKVMIIHCDQMKWENL